MENTQSRTFQDPKILFPRLKPMQGQTSSPQLEMDIARLEKEIESYSQEKLCYEAQILRVFPNSVCVRACVVICI